MQIRPDAFSIRKFALKACGSVPHFVSSYTHAHTHTHTHVYRIVRSKGPSLLRQMCCFEGLEEEAAGWLQLSLSI
jgi:hypothetical protein